MTGGVDVGLTAIKVGVAVIQRVAPSGLQLVRSILKGKEVVVVGPPRAGKTTFVDYLQYGLFEDEKDTSKTYEVTESARFNIRMGKDSALELSVSRAVDVPGQIGPIWQADELFYRRPHAIIVLTDLTAPLHGDSDNSAATWLQEFSRRLETIWRAKGKKRNRVKTMILVMNKADKADPKELAVRKQCFREILDVELRQARGEMLDDIAIMPSILVTNPEGTKAVDAVIAHLAKALVR